MSCAGKPVLCPQVNMPFDKNEFAILRRRALHEHKRAKQREVNGQLIEALEKYARVSAITRQMSEYGREHMSEEITQLAKCAISKIKDVSLKWVEQNGTDNLHLLKALEEYARARVSLETLLRFSEEGALDISRKKQCPVRIQEVDQNIEDIKLRLRQGN